MTLCDDDDDVVDYDPTRPSGQRNSARFQLVGLAANEVTMPCTRLLYNKQFLYERFLPSPPHLPPEKQCVVCRCTRHGAHLLLLLTPPTRVEKREREKERERERKRRPPCSSPSNRPPLPGSTWREIPGIPSTTCGTYKKLHVTQTRCVLSSPCGPGIGYTPFRRTKEPHANSKRIIPTILQRCVCVCTPK